MNKTVSVYNKIAQKYHNVVKTHFYNAFLEEPSMLRMIKTASIKNKKVLDLGCGSGRYTKILLRFGGKVWGVDPSEKLLDIAKKENKKANFILSAVDRLPFESGFFDVVVAGLVINHFRNLSRSFKEINRVLKRGGIFIFSGENPYTQITEKMKDNCYKFKNYFKEGKIESYWPTFGVKMTSYHKTFETLIKTIIKSGFSIEDFIDAKPVKKAKKLFPKEYKLAMNKLIFYVFKVKKIN